MVFQEGHGIRDNTRFWRGPDKYDYHANRRMNGGRISLRCVLYFLEKCSGRCSAEQNGTAFRQTTPHNHAPDLHKLQERAFRHALMQRCKSGDATRFKKMYKQERLRLKMSAQNAARIPLVKLRSSMRRARLQNRPRLPHSLKDLDKILRQNRYRKLTCTQDGKDNVYAGRAGSARIKTISVIFMSRRMRKFMNKRKAGKIREIFCDATFCPTPRGLKACQVWNLSTVWNHHVIPLARVLMRKRRKANYLAALEKIKTLAPRLKPVKIITDYEGAEQNALAEAFPDAELHGCLFHYSKAIGTNARKLGMYKIMKKSPAVRSLVRWLSCMPLLPTQHIRKGFRVIARMAVKRRVSRRMEGILKYWVKTWHPKIHLLSVSGCADRTTNASESDNRSLQDAVPVKRPNVWDFIDGVIDMEDDTYLTVKLLQNPQSRPRPRPLAAVCNDRTIKQLTEDLDGGYISVKRFLKVASRTTVKSLNLGLNGKKKRKNT